MADGRMDYIIGIDDSELRNGAAKVNRQFDEIGSHAQEVGSEIDSAFKKAGAAIGAYFTVDTIKDFAASIFKVRSEMQSLQISFETLLGSQEKANALFNEMKTFAVSTPMQLNDLASAAQTMLGFGIAAEDIMPNLKALGDISMGDTARFQSLSLAFSQMSATGKLMGQDLLQMINAGFNPLNEISKKTGKSVAELKEEMSNGAISAKMVADAFKSAAGEGGQFHGMLEKQSKGLKGALSNLEGAWQDALNSMGEQSEGVFTGVIDLATAAVKNFDKLGVAILTVVAAYGEYKGSLMAIEAYQSMIASQEAAINEQRLSDLEKVAAKYRDAGNTAAIEADTAATMENTAAKDGNVTAIEAEIAAIQQEIEAELAVAEAKQAAALEDMNIADNFVQESAKKVDAKQKELEAAIAGGDADQIAAAQTELAAAKNEMATAAEMKRTAAENVATTTKERNTVAQKANTLQTEIDTVNKKANTAATGLWAAATDMATTAMNNLKAAFMSNPFGIALVAITSIIGLLTMFSSETEKAGDAVTKFKDKVLEEQNTLNQSIAILNNVQKGSNAYMSAMENINKTARQYNATELDVNDTLDEQKRKLEDLTAAIKAQSAEKAIAEATSKAQTDAMEAESKAMEKLADEAASASHKVMQEVMEKDADGVVYSTYKLVDEASTHIREIAASSWSVITTEMTSASQRIADAFKDSNEAGKKAIEDEVAAIEEMLRGMKATDKEIEAFHDDLYEYVETSAQGFIDANQELEHAQAQLKGFANATQTTSDITNDSIKNMNFEQLTQALVQVQGEMDEINARRLDPQVGDTSRLEYLESLLISIKQLMGETLTEGSDAQLSKRLSDLKKQRDAAVYGSDEWNNLNRQIGQLDKTLSAHRGAYAETRHRGGGGGGHRNKRSTSSRSKRGSRSHSSHDTEDPKIKKAKEERERKEDEEDRLREDKRNQEDYAFETRQNEIDLLKDGTDKVIAQLRLDFDRRKVEIQRGYEDLAREKYRDARDAWEDANKNKLYTKTQSDTEFAPTDAEKALYGSLSYNESKGEYETDITKGSAYKAALHERDKGIEEANKKQYEAERQAMWDFLKEYGTYQEKKKAITDDYDNKIAKATTQGEKLALQQQMEEALAQVDLDELSNKINWEAVFSNLDSVSIKTLKDLKQQLKDALDAKDISADNARVITERIAEIDKQLNSRRAGWRDNFGLVIPELEEQKRLIQEAADAQERLNKAQERQKQSLQAVADAQAAITKFIQAGGKTYSGEVSMGNMQDIMNLFQGDKKSLDALSGLFGKLSKATTTLTTDTKALGQAQGEAAAAGEAAGGSMAQTVAIIDAIVHKVNENVQSANELVKEMGLEDTKFGKGFSSFAESSQYATQAWESLKNGNIMGVATGVVGSLRTLGEALGAWGLGGFGSSDKNLLEDIERLTASNEALRYAVDALTEEMEKSSTAEALSTYNKITDDINQSMANTQEMMSRAAAAYNNGFLGIGGKGSSNKKIDEKVAASQWARVSQITGASVKSASDFFNLTSEQMYKVAKEAPEIYALIKTYADDGYQDAAQFMDDYIEYWKQLEEAEQSYFEKMSSTSLDSIVDDFTNALMDMDSKASDFSKNFEKYMQQAIINGMVSNKYQGLLKNWYESFAKAMEDGMTKGETEALRNSWDAIVQEGIAERNALRETFGWTDTQSQDSNKKGFATASQDSIDELNGRFTAVQMSTTHIEEMLSEHIVNMEQVRQAEAQRGNQLSEMTNLIIIANNNLETIAKNTRELYGIREDIASIKRNTDKL